MRIAASFLWTGFLLWSYFSSGRSHASLQNEGQTELAGTQSQGVPDPDAGVYDPDPDHIWNRLFRLFYVRESQNARLYGGDELDPYLWSRTKYLLTGPSHEEALKLLDEFLRQHSENLIRDPVRRAFFQRDLLAVYESLRVPSDEKEANRSELQTRIAEIIRRLSLTPDAIAQLPVNYMDSIRAQVFPTRYDPSNPKDPFLPADLFDPNGPWVCLGEQRGRPVASDHLESFQGRSVFLVFFQVPGGRPKTLEYVGKLRNIPKNWGPNLDRPQLPDFSPVLVPYPEPPQFPIGTSVALVRRLVLIDDRGHPTSTHLTESVQIRVYRAIHFDLGGTGAHSQDFSALTLSRRKLFLGELGGLRAIAQGDKEFTVFHSQEIDPFEMEVDPESWQGVVLRACSNCHEAAGIHSFLSYSRERFGPTDVPPPKLIASTPSRETAVQLQWIERHSSLALANGMPNHIR
jgi:hypothetical protein